MSTINFDEMNKNSENKQQFERKTASPGVDVFTIEEAEVKNNVNGKEFIGVKFVNGEGKYFKEQFYTNGFGGRRVAELAQNAGLELKGEVTTDDVAAQLIGTSVGLIVGGEKTNEVIEGKEVAVTRARIKGAYNFSFKSADLEKYKDAKITVEDKTVAAASPLADNTPADDLPF